MSAQACYPGDPYPYGYPYGYPVYPQPHYPISGTAWSGTAFGPQPVTEDRIREIIREELRFALESLKETK